MLKSECARLVSYLYNLRLVARGQRGVKKTTLFPLLADSPLNQFIDLYT